VSRAAKRQMTQAELHAFNVSHALCRDETRTHLVKPFGIEWQGVGYVGATDGHRLSLQASESWRDFVREDAPRCGRLLDSVAGAPCLGSLSATAFGDECRIFPATWDVWFTFGRGSERGYASVSKVVGSGKNEHRVYPFGRAVSADWIPSLDTLPEEGLAVRLGYLLDAVDFINNGSIPVFCAGTMEPIVLLPVGARAIAGAERIALVMPTRA